MNSPFPGMDPYLETHWGDVRTGLVVYSCDQLQPLLPTPLIARIKEREFWHTEMSRLEEDEPVTETSISIIDTSADNRVVTVIEIVSPWNKTPGYGQDIYLKTQREYAQANVSLVEIDLLRTGERNLAIPDAAIPRPYRTLYQISVFRAWKPDVGEIYPVPLEKPLPSIRIPLREQDEDVRLELQVLLDQAYRNGRYFRTMDYTTPLNPPLPSKEARWARQIVKKMSKGA